MATSKNCDESPSTSGKTDAEKPKSSPARKIVLLLLLIATIVVVGLDYLPEGDSETKVVGPAKKAGPATQSPAVPQRQPNATPRQPDTSPAPTPPQYERPPATILVSSSPSDMPAPAPAAPAMADVAQPSPAETATPVAVAAAPAPTAQLVASRSPAPSTILSQDDPELVIVVGDTASSLHAAVRPLPEGPIPTKVSRYARRLLSRYDANRDGVIDATEQQQMSGDPTSMDYNADEGITLNELAAYTADFGRHRHMRLTGSMVEDAVAKLPPLYIPTAERDAQAAAQAAVQKAAEQAEAVPVALAAETVDPDDADTESTEDELVDEEAEQPNPSEQPAPAEQPAGTKRFVTPKSRLAGLPQWFLAKDSNGDGQLTVAEYAPNSEKASLTEFTHYDRNNDGVLTAQECPKK